MTLPKGKAESGAQTLQKLKKSLGSALLEIMLGVTTATVNKWIKGDIMPNSDTVKTIALLDYIWDTLSGSLSTKDSKLWLVSHSDYLYGIPATEIRSRPEDVYLAALNRISRGEDGERIREQLESHHESHELETDDI